MEQMIHPADEARKLWIRWQEAAVEQGVETAFDDDFISSLKVVWEGSDYVAQCCLRDMELLPALYRQGELLRAYGEGEIAGLLRERLKEVSDEISLHRTLRRFRRDHMVRIIWRDLTRSAPLAEVLEDLSALADACIEETLTILYGWAIAKQGIPRGEEGEQQYLVVLGMGKLGARELNLSSDIDLIFTFPEQGEVDGPRAIANEQFFMRLCQQLVKALNTQTADGFVFRVDTRLRPFGDAGPLALCFDAMETYYQSNAREWERYAMVKVRVVAGDFAAGEQLMAMLRPFVYRRYLDFGAIESIRDMKRLISRELKRKGMRDNVKLGPGGIREIEFVGQAFQLVRGGRIPELQIRPILPVLKQLGEKELLPEFVVRELEEAYEFLRLVENRIQAWQDRQSHLLPENEVGRLRMARSMGFDDWETFHSVLENHRQRVQGHFDQVFAAPQVEGEEDDKPLLAVWQQQLDDEQAEELLVSAGYSAASAALEKLKRFHDSNVFRNLTSRGRDKLDQLMPLLLEAVGGTDDPVATLERLLRLVETIARRTAYLALLVERPLALSQLVRLSSISPWVAQQVMRHPLLLDEMLDPRRLYTPLHKEALEAELDTLMSAVEEGDQEQQMERLRLFSQSNMLRVAAADITDVIPLMVVSDYLTEIAEVVTSQILTQAWQDLTVRHGRPVDVVGEETGFAVIGYGKLGGLELGYGSDLDLVFLHGNSNANAMTDGDKPVSNDLFYARMGQRMIHAFTTRMASGILYEVDMRLRPNGNAGLLVSSLNAFSAYQKKDAWTWEHQALLRARPVAGDPEVLRRFQEIRREVLICERDEEALRRDVREMREKMRNSLDKSKPGQFDLKQGCGGIADIEFMVQYAVLRWAYLYPDLIDWTDNIRLLETLDRHQLLAGRTAEVLAYSYRVLRAAYHRNALGELSGLIPDDRLEEERQIICEIWDEMMLSDSSG
ncbi:MAG: bifunctional [glutamate--ammonia ligase]-adenylyl-L-tyrosine phosphorylase/[glutamate--ammonia-ligase] adenylyltransferase [Candidatus Sedimenticola sp. (ex Thyasira tokunagai)]